jgi:hypothetical protein
MVTSENVASLPIPMQLNDNTEEPEDQTALSTYDTFQPPMRRKEAKQIKKQKAADARALTRKQTTTQQAEQDGSMVGQKALKKKAHGQ